jgi:hypothetical protein
MEGQQNQAESKKRTLHARASEKGRNHRAAEGGAGMAETIQKTTYMYQSSGIAGEIKVSGQIRVYSDRFVRNRCDVLPSN